MKTPKRQGLLLLFGLFLATADAARAGDWPGWRGPTGAGFTEEKDLPLTWGGKKNENVLWKVKIPGRGHCSPAVWGDRVFVTTAIVKPKLKPKETQVPDNRVICYAAADGKELWNTAIPPGAWPMETPETYAVPTPVTDGKHVFAWFGSSHFAQMVALDVEGKVLWHKEFAGKFSLNPALSSSPVLYKDTVIQLFDQYRGAGLLLAFDKKTGAEKWRQERKKVEVTNCTPVLIKVGDRTEMIVNASNSVQGIDPEDGKLLWWATGPYGFGASVAYGKGLIYAENGAGGSPGVCVDPNGEGDVTKTSHVKWQIKKTPGSYSSPIIVGNYVYRAHKPGILECWDLASGKSVFSERLKDLSQVASPFATPEGRIYFATPAKTWVIKAGPKLEVLAENSIQGGGDDGPSAAVANGRIFLKTSSMLFCVGKK